MDQLTVPASGTDHVKPGCGCPVLGGDVEGVRELHQFRLGGAIKGVAGRNLRKFTPRFPGKSKFLVARS